MNYDVKHENSISHAFSFEEDVSDLFRMVVSSFAYFL